MLMGVILIGWSGLARFRLLVEACAVARSDGEKSGALKHAVNPSLGAWLGIHASHSFAAPDFSPSALGHRSTLAMAKPSRGWNLQVLEHAVNTSLYARKRHPWRLTVPTPVNSTLCSAYHYQTLDYQVLGRVTPV